MFKKIKILRLVLVGCIFYEIPFDRSALASNYELVTDFLEKTKTSVGTRLEGMIDVAQQAADETKSAAEVCMLVNEYNCKLSQINTISHLTVFDGVPVLKGSDKGGPQTIDLEEYVQEHSVVRDFQFANDSIDPHRQTAPFSVHINPLTPLALGLLDIRTSAEATAALTALQNACGYVDSFYTVTWGAE